MEGIILLCFLSLAMLFGSYFAGSVPLAMTFSESKLRFVSIFGAGLLVGTALAVIIPEGVQSLYDAEIESHNRQYHKEAEQILAESVHQPSKDFARFTPEVIKKELEEIARNQTAWLALKQRVRRLAEFPYKAMFNGEKNGRKSPANQVQMSHGAHGTMGMAMVSGFVLMLVVDQITRSGPKVDSRPRYKITATVGLIVHAAADGIALGAASASQHSEIQLIVFVAIMLHKVIDIRTPAAFGLVTFLLLEGLEKSKIRRHLLSFSLAAPLMTIVTYVGIVQIDDTSLPSQSSTGILMLFSAGTFLYVSAVHILPELIDRSSSDNNAYTRLSTDIPSHHGNGSALSLAELAVLIIGVFLPVFFSIEHSH